MVQIYLSNNFLLFKNNLAVNTSLSNLKLNPSSISTKVKKKNSKISLLFLTYEQIIKVGKDRKVHLKEKKLKFFFFILNLMINKKN